MKSSCFSFLRAGRSDGQISSDCCFLIIKMNDFRRLQSMRSRQNTVPYRKIPGFQNSKIPHSQTPRLPDFRAGVWKRQRRESLLMSHIGNRHFGGFASTPSLKIVYCYKIIVNGSYFLVPRFISEMRPCLWVCMCTNAKLVLSVFLVCLHAFYRTKK